MVCMSRKLSARILDKETRVQSHLITVSPRVVLHTDVLIGILGALLKRGHVLPVLPMLVPEVVGVDAAADQAGDDGAVEELVRF